MRVALLKGARINKIKEPLEKVGFECVVVSSPFKILDVDAVITDTPGIGIIKGWILKKLCRTKLIFRIRGNYWQEVKSEGKFYRIRKFLANKILFRLCDEIVAVNLYLKREVFRNTKLCAKVVGIPIDAEKFDVAKSDSFNVLTVTNFNYYEKIKPLFKFGAVIDEFLGRVGGKWLIAGRGRYVEYFLKKTKELRKIRGSK